MPDSLDAYRKTARRRKKTARKEQERRRREGRAAARRIAADLRRAYDADQIVLFGSIAGDEALGPRSDLDLAVRGLDADAYYEAVARVQDIGGAFEVDLVRIESCPRSLRERIQQEGCPL
jgi:predicted nucleotidyltransferase